MSRCSALITLFLCAHADDTPQVLVCNAPASTLSQDLVDAINLRYPVSTAGCSDAELSDQARIFKGQLPPCRGCRPYTQSQYDAYVRDCNDRRARAADQAAGLNARIPASAFFDTQKFAGDQAALLYVDYALGVDATRSTMHSLDGTTLLWTAFAITQDATNCTLGQSDVTRGACSSDFVWLPPLKKLSAGVLTIPGRVGQTLALDGLALAPDLVLQVPDNTLTRTTRPGSRDTVVAVHVGTGCGTLRMTVRVQWALSAEPVRGASMGDAVGFVACWKRSLTVYRFEAVPLLCALPYPLNELRGLLRTSDRDAVKKLVTQADWATSLDGQTVVKYPAAQADLLLECAQPSSASGLGGTWQFWTTTTPGLCVACTEWDAATLQASKMRVRACNRSLPAEIGVDCCRECRTGYMRVSDTQCAPWCRPGTQYLGGCWPCDVGLYSLGGMGTCQTCAQLGFWNAYPDKLRGCVVCDARTVVKSVGSGYACMPCPDGTRVAPGSSICTGCGGAAYYLPAASTVCTACPAGTFMDARVSTTSCQTCAANYISSPAATACTACAAGTRHGANHTACIACPSINASQLPFTVYAAPGCAASCRAGASYQRSSPLVVGGCASCSTLAVPVGRYLPLGSATYVSEWITCPATLPCTNAPAHAAYTGPSLAVGASQCPFACNAGYTGASCAPCVLAGFDASVHQLVGGCNFTCKPFVYVDAGRVCRTPCVNLLNELIGARVRDYTPAWARPFYVFGVCGTTQAAAASPLPALRRALWAYVNPRGGALCGDAILNTGEACDDGNAVGGDGCSAACTVEPGLWDCDLIGAPCLAQCGWPTVAARAGDIGLATWGFILPLAASCDGLRYVDVRDGVTDRLGWMRANLVSCDCDGRPYRALPYANCTVANRGCRICAAGLFHDDVRSVCVACGTTCAPGFAPAPTFAACGQSVPWNASLAAQQLAIGCVACPVPSVGAGAITYIASPCRYACRRGLGASPDTYCADAPDIATGICSSYCKPCDGALAGLLSSPPPTPRGWYPQGCTDGIGYVWAQCDAAALPANAVWSSNTNNANDARGCGFACAANALLWDGACYLCAAAASCRAGQHVAWCSSTTQTCVPCAGVLPGALQAWTSLPPYTSCTADCEAGVGYAAQSSGQCQPCTRLACALGELFHACVPRADAYCAPCPARADHTEFIAPGDCGTRCAAGFYASATACLTCAIGCAAGSMPSKACLDPAERLSPPTCLPCTGALLAGAAWGAGCTRVCGKWMLAAGGNGTARCVLCDPAACGLGQGGACEATALFHPIPELYATTRLACTPCDAPPAGTTFAMAGLCTAVVCLPRFVPNGDGTCVPAPPSAPPAPTPAPATLVLAGGSSARPELQYPVRSRRHS